MALTLPTLTINDPAKEARLLAAFDNSPAEYRVWLKRALVREVIKREQEAVSEQAATEMVAIQDSVEHLLDGV